MWELYARPRYERGKVKTLTCELTTLIVVLFPTSISYPSVGAWLNLMTMSWSSVHRSVVWSWKLKMKKLCSLQILFHVCYVCWLTHRWNYQVPTRWGFQHSKRWHTFCPPEFASIVDAWEWVDLVWGCWMADPWFEQISLCFSSVDKSMASCWID